ncbi:G-type lectin S-receptor-like Serine/Threonine-kinase [Medicago truncatula]|uniref:Receptor-like serine/threonine-protein kinase n=1 Tax=Medicago truncatula TaxID=3880 RepID=G7IK62_MEDTR|nr:G-type lectin S-receptor-like Serine/Threonine-kinase [Medicago truncatula]
MLGLLVQVNMLHILFFISTLYMIKIGCASMSTITSSQLIKYSETISSSDDAFKLGFFSPVNTTNRYVGIWYLNQSNIIWVANREKPIQDSSGVITISDDNTNLVVLNRHKHVIWSSNVSSNLASSNSNVTAQLQNTGNLILQEDTTGNIIWESFKHPSDAFLPNMIISTNQRTGEKVKYTSWKTPLDPAIGNFSLSLERLNSPEVFVWNQTKPYWRSGPWNGQVLVGLPSRLLYASDILTLSIGRKDNGSIVETTYTLLNSSFFAIATVNSEGKLVYTSWMNGHQVGTTVVQENECDIYGFCGPNGSCDLTNSPICTCLKGFEPRNVDEWNRQNWISGCARKASLQCERVKYNGSELGGKGDGFVKLEMTKIPDFVQQSYLFADACRTECLNNCSCVAYAYDDGIRCLTWSGNLIDIVRFSSGGIDLYIRQAYSELYRDGKRNFTKIIISMGVVGAIIFATASYFLWSWASKYSARRKIEKMLVSSTRQIHPENRNASLIGNVKQVKIEDLPLFEFQKISTATNNFGSPNKIGQGGFGSAYKGELQDGLEIAVKRLSKASGQGLEEFMNEVIVISKLQHRNLVRLLGCCIEGEEKMLVYEYMPNNSLDFYLFDPIKKKILDWQKRLYIIEGISRGLLYLHRDSRLRIIHRDLKPSNILLDGELNPKISDFGMARIFGGSENEGNTRRIVGTYGYMSPEYAMEGLFSEKSDVFSFGVLLLEIISGRKNTSFYNHQALTLLGYTWKLWNEDEVVALIDQEICNADYVGNILRCIHIGLLCVQEIAKERPTMATVVSMLNSEIVKLPHPSQPAFLLSQTEHRADSGQQNNDSNNSVTVTSLQGR